jgi:PAS domain S-box-containing protein
MDKPSDEKGRTGLQAQCLELEAQNGELRRSYEKIDAERERYSDLFDFAPVGYLRLDGGGNILEANREAEIFFGLEAAGLVGRPLTSLIANEDRDLFSWRRARLFEIGANLELELRMIGGDGGAFWVHMLTRAIRDENGADGCLIAISDISARRQREEARELTTRFLLLVNSEGDFRECVAKLLGALREWTGCEAVGIRLRDGEDYPYYETKGFPPEHIQAENRLCSKVEDGKILRDAVGNPVLECMCGNILQSRFDPVQPFFTAHGSFWTNGTSALLASSTEEDRQARTRNRCNGEGYESVALIPMRSSGFVFGLVQFNDHRPDRFSPGLISQLEVLGDNLAIALGRRQAEEATRARESRFRTLFEDSPIGISEEDYSAIKARLDKLREAGIGDLRSYFAGHPEEVSAMAAMSRVLRMNRRGAEILGLKEPAELITDLRRFGTSASCLAFAERLIALAEGRVALRAEIPVRVVSGEERILDVSLAVSPDYSHDLSRVTFSYLDITEQKRNMEELLAKKLLLENIINTSNDLIFVKDKELRTLVCNEAYSRLVGKRPEDLVGKTDIENGWDPDYVKGNPSKDLNGYEPKDLAVLRGKTVHIIHDEMLSCEGRHYIFDTVKLPLRDPSGGIMGCLGMSRDITALVAANEVVSKRQRELSAATSELRKLNAYLIKFREEERRKVAQEIHDELGQKLTAMNLGLYWAAEKVGSEAQTLGSQLQGLIQLNRDTIASVQGLAASLRPGVLDYNGLKAALKWLVAEQEKLRGPQLSLICDFDEEVLGPEIGTAIFRLVQEALTNVLRHSRATQARVLLRQENNSLSISVTDDGIGISQEAREKSTSFGIIGMRERVVELGGYISVRGEAGMGTSVAIDLPLAPKAGARDD